MQLNYYYLTVMIEVKSFSLVQEYLDYMCKWSYYLISVFEAYKIKHLGERDNDVTIDVVNKITSNQTKTNGKIESLNQLPKSKNEKRIILQNLQFL